MNAPLLDDQVAMVVRQLSPAVDLPPAAIELEVRRAFSEWSEARVREYVPIFVERRVRERLLTVA